MTLTSQRTSKNNSVNTESSGTLEGAANISSECFSCKIVSYCATSAVTVAGIYQIKSSPKRPLPGILIGCIGLLGLATFIIRDIKKNI